MPTDDPALEPDDPAADAPEPAPLAAAGGEARAPLADDPPPVSAPPHDEPDATEPDATDDDTDDDEPSLRAHLAAVWRDAPPAARWGTVLGLLALFAWVLVPRIAAVADGPSDDERQAQAARDRAQWAAMLRRSPAPLAAEPVTGTLGVGDAERADDRYADYYVFEADSGQAFSVLLTSDAFAPDLAVRTPAGQTVAASALLRTATRAEIGGLEGPGSFEIEVTSEDPRATGDYELAVVPAGPSDSLFVDDPPRLDTLAGGPLRAGRFERVYGVAGGEGLPVVVRVVSTAFRPRLHLLGPNGEVRDAIRTMERSSQGDSLHGVVLRYFPGWDAPYRLLVSSEARGERGPFALSVESIDVVPLTPGDRGLRATLGDGGWIADGRYLDSYRFTVPAGAETSISVESQAFPPAFRLWRIDRRSRVDVTERPNEGGASAVEYASSDLAPGEYFLEVTSGGDADGPLQGGEYGLTVRAERSEPAPSPDAGPPGPSGPAPDSHVFATEVRRTGQSGGSTFEVGVTNVAISYPAGRRTRVQLSVTVRSVDYTGGWAPWDGFARQAYVVDDQARRYTASPGESQSPSGLRAEPGTARRGTVVFYLPEVARDLDRLMFVASIGERTVTLPITVP